MKDLVGALQTADDFCNATKSICGELSREYAEALYLKAKAQYNDPMTLTSSAMSTVRKCLHIWKNTPLSGGPNDLPHVLALLLKATFLGSEKVQKHREAIKAFQKAAVILEGIQNARMNTQSLMENLLLGYQKAV